MLVLLFDVLVGTEDSGCMLAVLAERRVVLLHLETDPFHLDFHFPQLFDDNAVHMPGFIQPGLAFSALPLELRKAVELALHQQILLL